MIRFGLILLVLGVLGSASIGCHAEGDVQKPSSSSSMSFAR